MNNPLPSTTRANNMALLSSWDEAKKELSKWKEKEAQLRADVISAFSEVDAMYSGTERVSIGRQADGNEYDVKFVHTLDYKLNQDTVDAALDRIEKLDNGELLAERLVKRTLELKVSEYKLLPDEARKIIDQVLTIKPASKQVEVVKASKR